jgi:hypothetical protein
VGQQRRKCRRPRRAIARKARYPSAARQDDQSQAHLCRHRQGKSEAGRRRQIGGKTSRAFGHRGKHEGRDGLMQVSLPSSVT